MIDLKPLSDVILKLENEDLKTLDIVCSGSKVDEKHKFKKNALHVKIKEEMQSRGLRTIESENENH